MNIRFLKYINEILLCGRRHMSETINQNIYEKINPKTKKVVKIIKGTCSICNRNKSQIFTL